MNDQRFDDLTRRIAAGWRARTSRRDLLRAAGLGGAITAMHPALGSMATATPATIPDVQTPQSRPPGGPTVAQLAFDLAYDPEALFRFVRDEVRYDPYPGALRSAKGTLWGLAGNAADQALLLAALLAEGLVETRFVTGELDEAATDRLFVAAQRDDATVRADAARVLAFTNPGSSATTPVEPTAEQQEALANLQREGQRLVEAARSQIAETLETLQTALVTAGVTLPEETSALPERERRQHIWFQYASGPDWIDLDPSFPDAEPGVAYARTPAPLDALPDDLFHTVTLRAVAEIVTGGQPVRQDLLTFQARAADLAGESMTLLHITPQALKGVGLSIGGIVEGTTQYAPHLVIGADRGESGSLFTFNVGEGALDVLGGGAAEGEAIAEWLEFDVAVPDQPVRTVTREIFDRVGIERRAAGDVDPATLPPVELTELDDGERAYLPLLALTRLAVIGHEVPGSYFDQDYTIADPEADMAQPVYAQGYSRSALALDRLAESGWRVFPDAPNLTAFTIIPWNLATDAAEGQIAVDLIHHRIAAVPTAGTRPTVHPGLYAGVLGHAAERMVLDGSALQAAAAGGTMPNRSVGRVFEAAGTEGVAIRTLLPGDTLDPALAVSERARVRITDALAAGYVVVVPERAVVVDGEAVIGWWQIDPRTGETFDLMESGMGVVALSPMGETAVKYVVIVVRNAPVYKRLGLCVFFAMLGATLALGGAGMIVGGLMAGTAMGNAFAKAGAVTFPTGTGLAIGAVACLV